MVSLKKKNVDLIAHTYNDVCINIKLVSHCKDQLMISYVNKIKKVSFLPVICEFEYLNR